MKRIVLIGAFAVSSLLPLGAQNDGGISDGMLQRIRASYEDTPADRALRNAICNNDIRKLVVNQPNQGEIDTYFSHRVPSKGVTDQQQSGRCWLFSGLNVLRARMIARYGLGAFEFSQNYCFFWDQLEKANMELHDLSLLTVDAIPEDAACLLIYAPTSDISGEERDMLADYVTGGGKLLVMAGPVDGASLDNLYSLLSKYGVTANEGIVIESDREHYAFQAPFALLPDLASSAITDSLIDERYFPILPLSLGLTVGEDTNIQDGAILHEETVVGRGCTIGHGAIVHGCTVGDNTLIGMGAIVLNGAKIGSDCIVGAGALVTGKMDAPDGSMILGSPAKVVRPLKPEEIEGNRAAMEEYLEAAAQYRKEQEAR